MTIKNSIIPALLIAFQLTDPTEAQAKTKVVQEVREENGEVVVRQTIDNISGSGIIMISGSSNKVIIDGQEIQPDQSDDSSCDEVVSYHSGNIYINSYNPCPE